jgi:CubicO group peptidase (beta-lactamase class C family)
MAVLILPLLSVPVAVAGAEGAGAPQSALDSAHGADSRRELRATECRRILREVHDLQKNVGLSAAVSVDGEIVFEETFGLASLELHVPVDTGTRFLLASLTKAFTGATLMKLREKGLIDLDAPITRYLPEAPAAEWKSITARLLAAHLGGIRGYRDGEKTPEFHWKHFSSAREAIGIFLQDPLASAPGSAYAYTSFGYNILAAVMEAASGQPYASLVAEEVLRPLGLQDTAFDDVRAVTDRLASNYTYYAPYTYEPIEEVMAVPHVDYSYNQGGGNMVSTARDLIRFGEAFTRPGFFNAESLALFRQRQGVAGVDSPWSFGWFAGPGAGEDQAIYITGAFTGVQSALWVWPARRIVVVVLSNCWGIGSRSGDMVIRGPSAVGGVWKEGWRPESPAP